MKGIVALYRGELVTVICNDGDKFVRFIDSEGCHWFGKAATLFPTSGRVYCHRFSRKLLKKTPVDKEFWRK